MRQTNVTLKSLCKYRGGGAEDVHKHTHTPLGGLEHCPRDVIRLVNGLFPHVHGNSISFKYNITVRCIIKPWLFLHIKGLLSEDNTIL